MEKLKSKRVIIPIALLLVIIIVATYIWDTKFHRKYSPPIQRTQQTASLKDQALAVCASGDSSCVAKNEQIKASQLSGEIVEYVKHQCDGPRPCTTPDPALEATATASIREYAKDPNLELIRITGINPAGIIFYCAANNRCWSIDTKNSKVTAVQLGQNISSASPSAKPKK